MGWRPGWIYYTANVIRDEDFEGILKILEENKIPYSTSYSPEHLSNFSIYIRKKDKALVDKLTHEIFFPDSKQGLEAKTGA